MRFRLQWNLPHLLSHPTYHKLGFTIVKLLRHVQVLCVIFVIQKLLEEGKRFVAWLTSNSATLWEFEKQQIIDQTTELDQTLSELAGQYELAKRRYGELNGEIAKEANKLKAKKLEHVRVVS